MPTKVSDRLWFPVHFRVFQHITAIVQRHEQAASEAYENSHVLDHLLDSWKQEIDQCSPSHAIIGYDDLLHDLSLIGPPAPPRLLKHLRNIIQGSSDAHQWSQQLCERTGFFHDPAMQHGRSEAWTRLWPGSDLALLELLPKLKQSEAERDATLLHLIVCNSDRSLCDRDRFALLNSVLASIIFTGDTVEQWSMLPLADQPAINGDLQGVSMTPLAMAFECGSMVAIKVLVLWGSSIGVPVHGPQPRQAKFTSPLHVAARKMREKEGFGPDYADPSSFLPFLERYAETEDLVTLDSNGQMYTEVLCKNQQDKAMLTAQMKGEHGILAMQLCEGVVAQDCAMDQVAEELHLFKGGMHDSKKPLVMLFMGPSRTGKTETAKQIAKVLGGRGVDIHLDMAQFSQAHEASNLHGAPLGYEGSKQGTLLSKISSFKAPAVVLLDEMDKAHPDVRQFFLAVFDEGQYTVPGDGTVVDCSRAVFIMTTNIGDTIISDKAEKLRDAKLHDPYLINFYQEWLKPALKNHGWRPELLSRIRVTVAFPPIISDEQKYRFVEHILKGQSESWAFATEREIFIIWSRRFVVYISSIYDPRSGPPSIFNNLCYKKACMKLLSMKHGKLKKTSVIVDMQPFANGSSIHVDVLDLADHRHAAVQAWSAVSWKKAKARRLAALKGKAQPGRGQTAPFYRVGARPVKMQLATTVCLFLLISVGVRMLLEKVSTLWV